MSMFARRQYVWLASAMRDIDRLSSDRSSVRQVIEDFANALGDENPNFDRKLFLQNIYGPLPGEFFPIGGKTSPIDSNDL